MPAFFKYKIIIFLNMQRGHDLSKRTEFLTNVVE